MSQNKLTTLKTRMIDIQFKDISYEVQIGYRRRKKQILKGLNGLFKSGELTAIMGTSGAGKSTLLNILSGFHQGRLTGNIEYNDQDKQNVSNYKNDLCYIQQTNYLHDLLTVQESMMIATYLKIGNVTHTFRQLLIDNILKTLNLTTIKKTKINGLSGGEKKRLSIALELIDNPPIMFLDEPTTGLDSLASLQCISALQTLAKNGRTIICTIHQPSAAIYQLFDHIYLIEDGQCVYADMPANTINYFAQQGFQCPEYHNPADYMLEVVSGEYGNYNNQLITAAKHFQRTMTPLKLCIEETTLNEHDLNVKLKMNPPSEMMKFMVLLCRSILLLSRDLMLLRLKIILHVLVAILLGLMFQHAGNDGKKAFNNVSYLVLSAGYMTYSTLIPAALTFPLELTILKKECFNNWYQLSSYYLVTLVISVPLQILFCLIYASISYLLTSQSMEWYRFFFFLLILVLTSLVSESIGLGLGVIFNPTNGIFCASIIIHIMIGLSGYLIFLSHMPVSLFYVSYINYFRFAVDGVVQAIYSFNRESLDCPTSHDHIIYCHWRIPSSILKELSMSKPTFWIDVFILFGLTVVIRIIVYVLLKRKLSNLR